MHINVINVYLLMSSTAKLYNFPKLSEAWVIFHGSKPEKKIESGISKSGGEATHNSILVTVSYGTPHVLSH